MKNKPEPSPESLSGRQYWRSLDELAETAQFKEWVEREFPQGASEWSDPVSRRHFVRIMSASFMLAGFGLAGSGCRRPEQQIAPFSKMPEGYIHGVAQFYATAMPSHGSAIPLVARSNDGRPTKLEGNALHPDSNGGTDRFTQASILNLYDPDRAMRFRKGGNLCDRQEALGALEALGKKAVQNQGQGLSILTELNHSPSFLRLRKALGEKMPQARWHTYEPVDLDVQRRAASQAFGKSVKPRYHFDQADVVVSLDADFLGSEEDVHNNIRRFSQRRHMKTSQDNLNRLYVVESLMSVTGFNADHRLRIPASAVAQVALGIAVEVFTSASVQGLSVAAPTSLPAQQSKWFTECAKDLLAHRGRCLVVAGYRQPLAVHLLANAINVALGNVGKTVTFVEAPEVKDASIADLAKDLQAGSVETLVVLGGNPVYNAPADLDWEKTQRKAKNVVRLGYYEDETAAVCDWHLPATHFLESWGDARTSDGTLVPIQPLIAPLFGGLTSLEVLARLGGFPVTDPYAITRETFTGLAGGENNEAAWLHYLHDGFLAGSAAKPVDVAIKANVVTQALADLKPQAATKDNPEVIFSRDYSLDDGRFANNGWLQEMPDPVTKIVWDNVILVSRKTAADIGVDNSQLLQVSVGERTITGPVWIQPGMADNSLGLALGYGRKKHCGRVGQNVGFDVYPLRTSAASNIAIASKVSVVRGAKYKITCTQDHWSMEGRPIIREANLEQYREHADFAQRIKAEEAPLEEPLYPNPFDNVKGKALHQWGMSIDLNMCVGCSACMIACQSENNVPIVGKDQVRRGREMHWIRIDRYYAGRPLQPQGSPEARRNNLEQYHNDHDQQRQAWIDDPQVVTQPMLCQHCEAAPCENVCPVNATSHDQEGLNLMTYNRCVGTRYCSNNCPYKVRRFNFFDYNKRPLDKLYLGPLATRKDDEWDLMRMIKNPDVTVRMRGVMEKCTYCIQRIESAKISQKVKAGASPNVVVPSDSFTTACAQACPAGAIVFGNLNDPESRVSKLKKLDRDYPVLEMLATRPRTTYLARVRNPNRAMPDYYEAPMSLQEFEEKMGDPFKHHGEEGGGATAVEHSAEKGAH